MKNYIHCKKETGYILPATVLLSLAIAILSVILLQFTVSASATLNNTTYYSLAQESATAGIRYAASCLDAHSSSWTSLTPGTSCSGSSNGGSIYVINNSDWRSTFTVSAPQTQDGQYIIKSTGTVQLLSGSTVVGTYQKTTKLVTQAATTVIKTTDGSHVASNAISIGATAACGTVDGQLYCWGSNSDGLLGLGTDHPSSFGGPYTDSDNAYAPYEVPALADKTITDVSVDYRHACAVTSDGALYCWGNNDYGQLGLGNSTAYNSPQLVSGLSGKTVTDVSAGYSHTCAVANSQLYCWGDNTYGQLGIGITGGTKNIPQLVSGLAGTVTEVGTGIRDTAAVSSGYAYSWGDNSEHNLGLNSTTSYSSPQHIASQNSVSAIAIGPNGGCGISSSQVWCAGNNMDGQLGGRKSSGYSDPPYWLPYLLLQGGYMGPNVSFSSDLMHNACATSQSLNGALFCWGQRAFPGGGTPSNALQITGGDLTSNPVTAMASGGDGSAAGGNGDYATCAVANGNIDCYGSSYIGLTGSGSHGYPDTVSQPTAIPNFVQIGGGRQILF